MTVTSRARCELDRVLELTIIGSFSRVGFAARRALFDWDSAPAIDLAGRVAVVTGATSGLGLTAAHLLARRGADLLLIGRDPARTEAARRSVRDETRHARVEAVVADLASLGAVRTAARDVRAAMPHIDVLVHNAGALSRELERTDDGLELTAQVHVVAPFLLTALLLPSLRASDDSRVITVSSGGMYTHRLDLAALERPSEPFDGVRAYANAKRAQVVLNEQWSRHPAGRGIAFHAMHPGWADTPGVQASLPGFRRVMRPLLRSAEQGADTMAWLAGTPEARASNGDFWLDRRRRTTTLLPWTHTPVAEARRLWNWCVDRSGARDAIEAMS
jgi:NAD(P)-dependent dehydrogenase (short-subunit alcohol dehydrogenase family)